MSLGPWSGDFSVPEWLDLLDVTDRLRGFVGMFAILAVAVFLSDNRRAISRRVVFWGLALQWGLADPRVARAGRRAGSSPRPGTSVESILNCALAGARFVFGDGPGRCPKGPVGFVFAFRVLPTVIFVAALFAVLYHLGVMQWVVRGFAVVMAKLMGTSGAESLNVAASLFLGQTEAPLTIRPYLARLTRSELLDGDDVGHGPCFRRGDGRLHQLRDRGAAHLDRGDHDGAGSDLALEDPGSGDRDSPRRSARSARPRARLTPTCSTPRPAAPATAFTWRSTSPRC